MASNIGIMTISLRSAVCMCDFHSSWQRTEILEFMGTGIPFGKIYRVPSLKGWRDQNEWCFGHFQIVSWWTLMAYFYDISYFSTVKERQDTEVKLPMEAGRSLASLLTHSFFLISDTSNSHIWWLSFPLVCNQVMWTLIWAALASPS